MNCKKALPCLFIFIISCDPLVTEFSSDEPPKEYTAKNLVSAPNKDTLTVATWNIRFGIGRANWFGDSCGDLVLFDNETILDGLELLAQKITEMERGRELVQRLIEQAMQFYIRFMDKL